MTIKPGALRFNTDSMKLEIFRGSSNYEGSASMAGIGTLAAGQWEEIVATSPEAQTGGALGLVAGGYGGHQTDIDKLTISTTGNAVDYGDLSSPRYGIHGASDRTRGVFAGGRNDPTPAAPSTTIDFVSFGSGGTAATFGSLSTPSASGTRGNIGNSTRGLFACLDNSAIDYITIQSTGNSQDFGDLTINTATGGRGAACSQTRGILFGGGPSNADVIEFVTTSTLGNSSDFGDLTQAFVNNSGVSNAVRAVIACGTGPTQPAGIGSGILEFITMSTLGNSQDFGDQQAFRSRGCVASSTRGVFAGGADPGTNIIDYVELMSKGDSVDFGDLTNPAETPGSCSNGHGGL